ncbi:hypothetical protein NUW58_g7485 [Xylaria curta]|uniref:Uncharacterized protein n=1 Tax=Xylaria curta TaxID=42375 RepID=A0ACC1NHC8_9PEZI|nr:hypothetical protein NUW58_g7485 [Xylaria curta]
MPPALEANPLATRSPALADMTTQDPFAPPLPAFQAGIMPNVHPSAMIRRSPQKMAAMQAQLGVFPRHARGILAQFVAVPYDSTRLKRMDREINVLAASHPPPPAQQSAGQFQEALLADQMKAFVRAFGRRERKRPRDRLLRDRKTKATVLRVRKQTAFLGYTFRRVMDLDTTIVPTPALGGVEGLPLRSAARSVAGLETGGPPMGTADAGIGPCDAAHVAAHRALHPDPRDMNAAW